MAKNKSKRGANADGAGGGDRIPAALKEFGQKAADLAQNPVARSVIAAGLVTAAAALTANQKVRDTARKTAKDAADATEEAAANATRVGEALVTAAADTFRKLFNLDEPAAGTASRGREEQTLTTPARRSPRKAKASAKAAPAAGKAASARSGAKKSAAKPKAAGAAKSKPANAKSGARKKAATPPGGDAGTSGA